MNNLSKKLYQCTHTVNNQVRKCLNFTYPINKHFALCLIGEKWSCYSYNLQFCYYCEGKQFFLFLKAICISILFLVCRSSLHIKEVPFLSYIANI